MSQLTVEQVLQQAINHHRAGQLADAEQLCRSILSIHPDHSQAWNLLGILAHQAGQNPLALQLLQHAARLNPASIEILNNLANLLQINNNLSDAALVYHQAIAAAPQMASTHSNLATVLLKLGRTDEAIDSLNRALQLNPKLFEAHSNLANALVDQGRFDQAIETYCQALRLDPNQREVHVNLAFCLLLKGEFTQGWPEYEWRWKSQSLPQPLWNGEPGKSVLLIAEQGAGDTLQFIRYLPRVAALASKITIVADPPLIPLLRQLPGVDEWIPRGDPLPACQAWRPLMSLPYLFRTTLQTIPNQLPLLKPNRSFALPNSACRKIGLAWAGNPNHKNDRKRSIPIQLFGPLFANNSAQFISLHKDPPAEQLKNEHFPILDCSEQIHDYADTAAIIDQLDLVITVDTSVAHLAGAMGKPIWVLLPKIPDWRWLLERSDSPWYPSMRLFRQTESGNWESVINTVSAAIESELSRVGK